MTTGKENIRVRIAPSPTGFLHIGGVRTAIFNWLFAKQHQGSFILRIEDTDTERSKPEYEKSILDGFLWLGLSWDEGPTQISLGEIGKFPISNFQIPNYKGNHGPYRQSERTEIYKKYLKQLLDNEKAYWCFCSKEDLEAEKQAMFAQGIAPKYSGRCKHLTKEQAEKRIQQGEKGVIRFKTNEGVVEFNDVIRGKVKFELGLFGDFVLAKNLQTPLYNFAAVIDDFEMKISHIIRGEEHLTNTPKQIILAKTLGFPEPIFAHLPLILAPDKSKLSKRFGATSLEEYKNNGYLPEALLNFLVLLGWHPEDEKEVMSVQEMMEKFRLNRVQKAGAVFNQEKLDWFNSYYIRHIDISRLTECIKDFAPALWLKNEKLLAQALNVEKERMKHLTDFKEFAHFFFELPDYPKEMLNWGKQSSEKVLANLEQIIKILENNGSEKEIMKFANEKGRGEVLWPLRVALSGSKASPGPFEIMKVLDKEECIKRIKKAIKIVDNGLKS